ncbi:3-phosphoshikimate 1-carboxyvinyltransferase, partial [Treponema sp. R6D11]
MPSNLKGSITAPPSKSILHRELIAGCLSHENSTIKGVNAISTDIQTTIDCLKVLGAEISIKDNIINCSCGEIFNKTDDAVLDCKDSGTTYRILKEFDKIYKGNIKFKKFSRPTAGYRYQKNEVYVDASATTQNLSGLLLVLPLLDEKYTIYVENLSSKSYIDLTLQTLERHGVYTKNRNYEQFITTPSEYKKADTEIEGDYSQSAFFMIANLLGADIKIHNLNLFSKQGDKEIINILNFNPKVINASNTPDIIPPLAVFACFNDYDTTFTNIEKLKIKESDRVKSILELNKLGA